MGTIQYHLPDHWIKYDPAAIMNELVNAKAAVLSLTAIPYQRAWAEKLQELELKREVAGTSRIEGADFTESELDEAIADEAPVASLNRSQRQARAAIQTYRWIEKLPPERALTVDLIQEVHRRIVTGCDDDHCPPGKFRGDLQNVTFGRPRHRGVEGGAECERAVARLVGAFHQEYRAHDPLIQALALHYHFAAMHPFLDGNGRTARAVEALLLQRSQLKGTLFIAMSNYYYDEKNTYLATLSDVRERNYDLTPFLKFALSGIATQCQRLLREIRFHVQKSLFRDVMGKMYGRLQSSRKRALAARQHEILSRLLDTDRPMEYGELYEHMREKHYSVLSAPRQAYLRDLMQLAGLGAIVIRPDRASGDDRRLMITVRTDWATEITETEFYKQINKLPEAKSKLIIGS